MTNPPQGSEFLPAIRRARLETLTLYDVTEPELQILERGSADSIYLNLAIALLSQATSIIAVLLTTKIPSDRLFQVFVILAVVGCVAGGVLLLIWKSHHQSVSKMAETIRKRLPPEGIGDPEQDHDLQREP